MGAVHPTAVVDESGRMRMGSGEARCEVRLIDGVTGRETTTPRSGSPVRLEVVVSSTATISTAVVGFGLRRVDGIGVASTTSRHVLPELEITPGIQTFTYAIDRLAPLPGSYDVSVEVSNWQHQHIVDRCEHALRLDVQPSGDTSLQAGIVDLGGSWVPQS